MLNRFGVKSRALSLKMHLVLPNRLLLWRYFSFYFFLILLEHGAFSSMRSLLENGRQHETNNVVVDNMKQMMVITGKPFQG